MTGYFYKFLVVKICVMYLDILFRKIEIKD